MVPVKGMNLILQGYDIFASDPLRTKDITDKGIQTTRIFKHDYEDIVKTTDGRTLPKRFTVTDEYNSCESSFSSKSLMTSSEMTKSIKKSVSVNGKVSIPISGVKLDIGAGAGAGSYSMSAENAMRKDMTVSSNARCKTKVLRMNDYTSYPDLSDDLTSWLDVKFDGTPSTYVTLFAKFGTHIPRELTIGAEFGATTMVSESQQSKLTEGGKNLETTLNVGIPFIFNVKTTTASEESRSAKNAMDAAGVVATTWSIGGSTVSNSEAFYEGATETPAPLVYKELESLCEVLDTKDINNFDMETCFKAIIPYCESVMKGTGYKCDVMLDKPNESFECVFDSHCSEPNELCAAGKCGVFGIEVVGISDTNKFVVNFNFDLNEYLAVSGFTKVKYSDGDFWAQDLKFCYKGEEFLWGQYWDYSDLVNGQKKMGVKYDKDWNKIGGGGTGPNGITVINDSVVNKLLLEPEKYYFLVPRNQSCVGLGYKY